MSSPAILNHVGLRMAQVASRDCTGGALIGIATSGLAWAAMASLHSGLPMLYVRKAAERLVSNKLIEGLAPEDRQLILVDDLLFAGESKREAIRIILDHGFRVTDILVVIDRQLQRKKDGPTLQDEFGLKLHALITMDEIVAHMGRQNAITDTQLRDLARDIRRRDIRLVHLHTCSGFTFYRSTLDLLVARLLRCRVVLHIHGGCFERFCRGSGSLGRWWIRTACR